MPNNELVNTLRNIIQEELKPVRQELQVLRLDVQELKQDVQVLKQDVQVLKQDVQELKQGQTALETAVNDLRAINRRSHKEIFNQLNAIWADIRLLSSPSQKEKAIK